MSSPGLTIQLDQPARAYEPGTELSGRFHCQAQPEQVRHVELSVLWHTEGKGDEDFGVHHFQRYPSREDGGVVQGWHSFSTWLPASPLSYDGAIVKIDWCVRARAFLKDGKELVTEKEFHLGHVPSVRLEEIDGAERLDNSR